MSSKTGGVQRLIQKYHKYVIAKRAWLKRLQVRTSQLITNLILLSEEVDDVRITHTVSYQHYRAVPVQLIRLFHQVSELYKVLLSYLRVGRVSENVEIYNVVRRL